MNLLGLIFSIILILSFSTYACFEKQMTSSRLRSTYLSYQKANRKILNRYQSQIYENCRGQATNPNSRTRPISVEEDEDQDQQQLKPKGINRECSRINLWPLVQDGKESHPELYELVIKLIREFYPELQKTQKDFASHFLNALLKIAKPAIQKHQNNFALEKLTFPDCVMQRTYYYMLKGTRKWDLLNQVGYPPLLTYIKCSKGDFKICVSHADLNLLILLFDKNAAVNLYETIHQKDKPALTRKLIEGICSESRLRNLDPNFLNLLELNYPNHKENKKIFAIEDEGGVLLRKNFSFNSPS